MELSTKIKNVHLLKLLVYFTKKHWFITKAYCFLKGAQNISHSFLFPSQNSSNRRDSEVQRLRLRFSIIKGENNRKSKNDTTHNVGDKMPAVRDACDEDM